MHKSDEELVEETSRGNVASFKELILRFQDRVYNTCFGFLKKAEDTQEIAQDVFIHIYENADSFRGESKAGTWIYRIAVNKSLEFIRWRSRKREADSLIQFLLKISGKSRIGNTRVFKWKIRKEPKYYILKLTLYRRIKEQLTLCTK